MIGYWFLYIKRTDGWKDKASLSYFEKNDPLTNRKSENCTGDQEWKKYRLFVQRRIRKVEERDRRNKEIEQRNRLKKLKKENG